MNFLIFRFSATTWGVSRVLQLIFRNNVVNEGFGVFGAEVSYVIGNYVK